MAKTTTSKSTNKDKIVKEKKTSTKTATKEKKAKDVKTPAKKASVKDAKKITEKKPKEKVKTAVKEKDVKTLTKKASTKASSKVTEKKAKKDAKAVEKKTSAKVATKTKKAKDAKQPKQSKFKINQKVVYPSQGVGKVVEIFEKVFRDEKKMYYKINIEVSDMIVMVPIDRAQDHGIRPIVSAIEAEKALKSLSDNVDPITSDWKLRYQINLDLLKKGSVFDIVAIVRSLYNRSKIKELPILERKLYDSARKLLEYEISYALGISLQEAEKLIHTKLEPAGSVQKVKHIISIDEDEDDNLMDDMNDSNDDDDGDDDASFDDDDAF